MLTPVRRSTCSIETKYTSFCILPTKKILNFFFRHNVEGRNPSASENNCLEFRFFLAVYFYAVVHDVAQ